MKRLFIGIGKQLLLALVYTLLGVTIIAFGAGIWLLNAKPELQPWHTTTLKNQFSYQTKLANFDEYLALEAKTKAELAALELVTTTSPQNLLNRYQADSLSSPQRWQQDWNWSFEWPNAEAEYGVLLLHGMSDSPYAMSNLAKDLAPSAHVLGLRLPGHGTLPSALKTLDYRDLVAATELAIRHMRQELGNRPLYIIGFSTGAALALNHELQRVGSGEAPDSRGLVLLSPAIGLEPMAAAASWQANIGRWLRMDKLAWNHVGIEYDPFKYVSFAVNAADVVYKLAKENRELLAKMPKDDKALLPSILTFQSMADDTVSPQAVIEDLYLALNDPRHRLVLYDVNRAPLSLAAMTKDPRKMLSPLMAAAAAAGNTVAVVQNQPDSSAVNYVVLAGDENGPQTDNSAGPNTNTQTDAQTNAATNALPDAPANARALTESWPQSVYSLSHVGLPFSSADSLYGAGSSTASERVQIGTAAARGERGIYGIGADEMLRQKWNPFYGFQLSEIKDFIEKQSQP